MLTWEETNIGRGPAFAKKPIELTDVTIASICVDTSAKFARIKKGGSYSLALERSPNHSLVSNCELGQPATWKDLPFGDVKGVEDGDDVVSTSAGSLNVLHQLPSDQLVHVAAKVGRVQGHLSLKIVKEEHLA